MINGRPYCPRTELTVFWVKTLSWVGLVWDIRAVPDHVLAEGRRRDRGQVDDLGDERASEKLRLAA